MTQPVLASQRSLHNAPIFRLLLKVAVNGTHQCDFQNFCGILGSQRNPSRKLSGKCAGNVRRIWLRGLYAYRNTERTETTPRMHNRARGQRPTMSDILAEGAIALSVTLSGGALFAS